MTVYLALVLATSLFRGKRVMFAYPRTSRSSMAHIKALIETGEFKVVVDRHYPLEQIVDAYRYVDTGTKIGSVVITVVPPK